MPSLVYRRLRHGGRMYTTLRILLTYIVNRMLITKRILHSLKHPQMMLNRNRTTIPYLLFIQWPLIHNL